MATNIVCSDTYIDAFSRLDKKIQKKSLETIRLMQRSLRSDSLKIEKLNTKLDFKSARVTQDFRAIFTQSGNTVLLVYIDHHDNAYLWASNRLQGFDTASAKPVYEYFEQAKVEDFDTINEESTNSTSSKKTNKLPKKTIRDPQTGKLLNEYGLPVGTEITRDIRTNCASPAPKKSLWASIKKPLFALFFFCLGAIVGIIITIMHFM